MNNKIRVCRKLVKIFLMITVVSGFATLLVDSNPGLEVVFRTIGLISVALALIIDLVKNEEIDRFEKEWVTN